MSFSAVNLANGDMDQTGFDTEEEACKYIEALVCDHCLEDLKRGYVEYEYEGEIERQEVTNVLQTGCGGPWFVITDKEYEDAEDIEDIFIAAGMKPADEKTEETLTFEQKMKLEAKERELEKRNEETEDDEDHEEYLDE